MKRLSAVLLAALLPVMAAAAAPASDTSTTMEQKLVIASYNIMNGKQVGHDFSVLAADLASVAPDIVGLQEVDRCTTRSLGKDSAAEIVRAMGPQYKYHRFTKACEYFGGDYGTAVISKWPIEKYESIPLESGNHEPRALGHAVIDIGGRTIDFFNTHLSYESKAVRAGQLKTIADRVTSCPLYLITGDFNVADLGEFSAFSGANMANTPERRAVTFPGNNSAIDNIVASPAIAVGPPATLINNHSDHYMLYTTVTLPRAK